MKPRPEHPIAADAARFVWWFSREGFLTLQGWRNVIDRFIEQADQAEDAELNRLLTASIAAQDKMDVQP